MAAQAVTLDVTVRGNIAANYLGQGWSAVMGLAFIPLYIHYLGIEAFGLIGVLASLQAWFALLDMGMTPTLTREMARFQAGAHTPQSIWELFRSLETVYIFVAVFIGVAVILMSPWLATNWLHGALLSTTTIAQALGITGGVIALRWIGGVYRGAIMGLQKQVWLNGSNAIFATLRGAGSVVVLAWVSPTIQAFFLFQGGVALLESLVLAIRVRHWLPATSSPVRFSWHAIHQVWRFAAGVTVITLLSILLMQVDKLLLSNLLPLAEFGSYTLAGAVASALYVLIYPVNNAAAPRLAELVTLGDRVKLVRSYHQFSQILTLSVVPLALELSLFADHVLLLWTRDTAITASVGPILSLLAIGTMMNGLMHLPYTLQLAHGWTRLTVWINGVSVLLLVPAIYVGVSRYGVVAAAATWALLNAGYLIVGIPLMHRKLLPAEQWFWYKQDVIVPVFAAFLPLVIVRFFAPVPALDSLLTSAILLMVMAIVALCFAALTTPLGRAQFRQWFCTRTQPL